MCGETDAALRASRAMLGIVARSVAPALAQVSLPQFRVLVLLHSGRPMRVGALAERLGVIVSTFSRSLDRLEGSGWVERTQRSCDRREITVSITEQGERLVQEVTSRRESELAGVLALVRGEDRALLDRAFTSFADIAREPAHSETLILGI